jgi:hypothetical protein
MYIYHHIACGVFGLVAYSDPINNRGTERDVKKLKNVKASEANNIASELYKYESEKF